MKMFFLDVWKERSSREFRVHLAPSAVMGIEETLPITVHTLQGTYYTRTPADYILQIMESTTRRNNSLIHFN
jgi:hypothetical protein